MGKTMGQTLRMTPNACAFEGEERDLPEVDTQLIPERNLEIKKYGKNL